MIEVPVAGHTTPGPDLGPSPASRALVAATRRRQGAPVGAEVGALDRSTDWPARPVRLLAVRPGQVSGRPSGRRDDAARPESGPRKGVVGASPGDKEFARRQEGGACRRTDRPLVGVQADQRQAGSHATRHAEEEVDPDRQGLPGRGRVPLPPRLAARATQQLRRGRLVAQESQGRTVEGVEADPGARRERPRRGGGHVRIDRSLEKRLDAGDEDPGPTASPGGEGGHTGGRFIGHELAPLVRQGRARLEDRHRLRVAQPRPGSRPRSPISRVASDPDEPLTAVQRAQGAAAKVALLAPWGTAVRPACQSRKDAEISASGRNRDAPGGSEKVIRFCGEQPKTGQPESSGSGEAEVRGNRSKALRAGGGGFAFAVVCRPAGVCSASWSSAACCASPLPSVRQALRALRRPRHSRSTSATRRSPRSRQSTPSAEPQNSSGQALPRVAARPRACRPGGVLIRALPWPDEADASPCASAELRPRRAARRLPPEARGNSRLPRGGWEGALNRWTPFLLNCRHALYHASTASLCACVQRNRRGAAGLDPGAEGRSEL